VDSDLLFLLFRYISTGQNTLVLELAPTLHGVLAVAQIQNGGSCLALTIVNPVFGLAYAARSPWHLSLHPSTPEQMSSQAPQSLELLKSEALFSFSEATVISTLQAIEATMAALPGSKKQFLEE